MTEIQGRFYDKQGKLLVEGTKIGLELIAVKAVIGATKDGSLGIVLGCNEKETDFIRQLAKKYL